MSELAEVAADEWDALLDRIGVGDVYLRRAYLESASLLGQGTPAYLHFGGDSGDVVFPALAREAGDSGYRDVATPMGYGGPVASGDGPPVADFFDAYERWCAANRVVATFARFHPVLANQRLAEGHWQLERIGHSIGWRVEGRGPDELLAGMDSHHRRVVRKARAAGVEVGVEESPADLGAFVLLYEETMRRRDASQFYFFPDAYWEHLTGALGGVPRPGGRTRRTASWSRASSAWRRHRSCTTTSARPPSAGRRWARTTSSSERRQPGPASTASPGFTWAEGSAGSRTRCTSSSAASIPRAPCLRTSGSACTTRLPTESCRERTRSSTRVTFPRTGGRAERGWLWSRPCS